MSKADDPSSKRQQAMPRRLFAGWVGAAALGALRSRRARAQSSPTDHGRIEPPRPVPPIDLTRDDGTSTTFFSLVNRRATALQVMFTRCPTTCPIEGAIFARVQRLLPDQLSLGIQLISLSIDPQNDTPASLALWLRRFHRRPGWIAAVPSISDVERVRDFAGRGRDPADNHSTQVQILDRSGRLVWRTGKLPAAEELAEILRRV
jgi:protein SCO1/2